MYTILDDGLVAYKNIETLEGAVEICEDLVAHMEDARDFPVEFIIKDQDSGEVKMRRHYFINCAITEV